MNDVVKSERIETEAGWQTTLRRVVISVTAPVPFLTVALLAEQFQIRVTAVVSGAVLSVAAILKKQL